MVKQAPTTTRLDLLEGGADRTFRVGMHAITAFSSIVLTLRDVLASSIDLSGIQYEIMVILHRLRDRDNGICVSDIASRTRRSGSFITIESGRLEGRGLLTMRPDPENRRRVLLRLSGKGEALLDSLVPLQQAVNDTLLGSVSRSEFDTLRRLVGKITPDGSRRSPKWNSVPKRRSAVKRERQEGAS